MGKVVSPSAKMICCGALLSLLCSLATHAQEPPQSRTTQQAPLASAAPSAARGKVGGDRPQPNQLLSLLNLSPEQRAEIRAIRESSDAARRAAAQRVRLTQRALEKAIYVDETSDAELEKYVQEATAAQAAATRLRAFTELRIRRVLTARQLEVLRELRRQARAKQVNTNNTGIRSVN